MQICSRIECINEAPVGREFSQDAQLDLRIIRDDQLAMSWIPRETATVFNCVWHLLNVGIGARESACRRTNLPEVRMESPGHLVYQIDHVLTITRQRFL